MSLKRWRSIWPSEHWLKGSSQIVLDGANEFVPVEWDDRGDSEEDEHHRLNRNRGSDDSAQKSVTSRKYCFIFLSTFSPEKKNYKRLVLYLNMHRSLMVILFILYSYYDQIYYYYDVHLINDF